MTERQTTSTAALIERGVLEIGDGYRAKNAEFAENGGLPFVRVGNVKDCIQLEDIDELPLDLLAKYGSKASQPFDSLITMKGTVGRVAFVPPSAPQFVYSPQISWWRSHDRDFIDPRWLRYWLESPEFKAQALATKGATDMADYINLRDQRKMRITLPPVATQRDVARVLGAIDDLIENNRWRIELLEQMAQAIYREWFVHFRYPGHENVVLVDSSLGLVPEGWEVRPLSRLASIVRGRSYRKHELVDTAGMPFVNLKCIMRGGGFRRDGLKRYNGKYKPAQVVREGDIVLAVTDLTQGREILARATLVPRLGEHSGVISLDVVRVLPDDPQHRVALFMALRHTDFSDRVKEFANGSTVLHLSPKHLAEGDIVWPPLDLRERFTQIVTPMLDQLDDLRDSADRLASIRDLLLPKLVTGQVDVSELDLDGVMESVA